MNKLRDVVIDRGCDPFDWTGNQRRECAIELYQADENTKETYGPTWINDALVELASQSKYRRAILDALQHNQSAMCYAALGHLVASFLVTFTLDHLQATAEEHETAWLREDREAAERDEIDSKEKARRA